MDPYYQDDSCTIYHGDCMNILSGLVFDAVVVDPPYGVKAEYRPHGLSSGERVDWDDEVPYEMQPMFGDHPIMWFGSAPMMGEAFATFDPAPQRTLVWAPRFTLSTSVANGVFYRYHLIYTWNLPKQTPAVHDVLTDNTECGNWWDHPATKPLTLMRRLVAMTGDGIVCDPFMGSGTTLRAAKDLGRKAIGIELDERYCEIAVERLGQGVLALGG